jgi:hypothetical protein
MSKEFFKKIDKLDIFANPSHYAWNCLLYYKQFSQEEILMMKEWIEVRELIKFQKSVTKQFLRDNFQKEIDDCLEVDWNDVDKYVSN